MWIHHSEPQATEWHHPTSPQKKLKATPSAGKVIVTVLCDAEGVILVVIMENGHTINSDLSIQTLNSQMGKFHPFKCIPTLSEGENSVLICHKVFKIFCICNNRPFILHIYQFV
jgi:hypothetical protein